MEHFRQSHLTRISHKNFEKGEPDRDLDWVNRREDIIQCDKASGDLSQDLSRGGSDFRKVCEKCGLTALLTKEGAISYKELYAKRASFPPIFYANPSLESIVRILSGSPIFPVSTRELSLPNIDLPSSGIVIATSGSTGKSKYAHLLLENILYSAQFPHPDLKLSPGDHYLLSTPLYHVSGLSILFRVFSSGATVVMPDAGKESLVTHVSFVPTQLKRFLKNPSLYPNLKKILVGGAPIPFSLCKEAYDKGFSLYLTYGMTEMASQIATKPFDPNHGVCFGNPLPGRELCLKEDHEIWVKGKTLFQGYLNLPSPFIDGFFPTKDLGRMGPYGLEILGRKDRMLISGGENIHPEEIELALLSHPQIVYAKVMAKKDPEFGERPIALVSSTLSVQEILGYLSSILPRYKIPDQITLQTDKESSLSSPSFLK